MSYLSDRPLITVSSNSRRPIASWRAESVPIYRVVEMTRDSDGRLREEGRIWHTDLDRMRKFGRAVAANSSAHKVVITDASGSLIEEIPIATPDERRAVWSNWERIPLPPVPAPAARRVPKLAAAPVPLPATAFPDGFEHELRSPAVTAPEAGSAVDPAVSALGDIQREGRPADAWARPAEAGAAASQNAAPAAMPAEASHERPVAEVAPVALVESATPPAAPAPKEDPDDSEALTGLLGGGSEASYAWT